MFSGEEIEGVRHLSGEEPGGVTLAVFVRIAILLNDQQAM